MSVSHRVDRDMCTCAKSLQLCQTLCDPMNCSPPGSSVHGILQAEYWSELPTPSPGYLPDPGIEPRSPTLQADALTAAPPGKPTGGPAKTKQRKPWQAAGCLRVPVPTAPCRMMAPITSSLERPTSQLTAS